MTDKIPEHYKHAVYNTFHEIIDMEYPAHRGQQNNLIFVRTSSGDFVAKFNSRDVVLKNSAVSRLASCHGIKTPDLHVAQYRDVWFEYYPTITGKTLHERIYDEDMRIPEIKRAFEDMLTQLVYMETLPLQQISSMPSIRIHDAAYNHGKITNGNTCAKMIKSVVYMLNRGMGHDIGLYHSDITPKNVIVDDKGRLVSFLDMDSMVLCNNNYAFSVMADKWDSLGFSLNELYDKYEYLLMRPISRSRINAMLHLVHTGKRLMFLTAKHKAK